MGRDQKYFIYNNSETKPKGPAGKRWPRRGKKRDWTERPTGETNGRGCAPC